MEHIIKELGFESEKEFHTLVASIDLSDPIKMKDFLDWKENDGTKQGLLKLFKMYNSIELIKQEREEQILKHGRTIELDIKYNSNYQLSYAVEKLCVPELDVPNYTPPMNWDEDIWNKMISKSHKERLIISGALIAAEIDRLNNL